VFWKDKVRYHYDKIVSTSYFDAYKKLTFGYGNWYIAKFKKITNGLELVESPQCVIPNVKKIAYTGFKYYIDSSNNLCVINKDYSSDFNQKNIDKHVSKLRERNSSDVIIISSEIVDISTDANIMLDNYGNLYYYNDNGGITQISHDVKCFYYNYGYIYNYMKKIDVHTILYLTKTNDLYILFLNHYGEKIVVKSSKIGSNVKYASPDDHKNLYITHDNKLYEITTSYKCPGKLLKCFNKPINKIKLVSYDDILIQFDDSSLCYYNLETKKMVNKHHKIIDLKSPNLMVNTKHQLLYFPNETEEDKYDKCSIILNNCIRIIQGRTTSHDDFNYIIHYIGI
jgi:hypothetical protein